MKNKADNTEEKKTVDLLNREEFVNRVLQIVDLISLHKGNMTFAINGVWGCGKSFVLSEIEKNFLKTKKKSIS